MDPASSLLLEASSGTDEAPMEEHGGDAVDELFAQALGSALAAGGGGPGAEESNSGLSGGGSGASNVASPATTGQNNGGSGTVSGPTISSSQVDGNGDTPTTVAPGTTAGAAISTGLGDGPSTVPDTAVAQSVSGPGPEVCYSARRYRGSGFSVSAKYRAINSSWYSGGTIGQWSWSISPYWFYQRAVSWR